MGMIALRDIFTILGTTALSIWLVVAPAYAGGKNLFEVDGNGSVMVVVPIIFSIFGSFSKRSRVFAGVLMLFWVVVGSFSVGLFYLPMVGCLLWPEKSRRRESFMTTLSVR